MYKNTGMGFPCSHVFRLLTDMSLNLFHIKHWIIYEAHYNYNDGTETEMGQMMVEAQVTACFNVERVHQRNVKKIH
jgi:hypothetical protein